MGPAGCLHNTNKVFFYGLGFVVYDAITVRSVIDIGLCDVFGGQDDRLIQIMGMFSLIKFDRRDMRIIRSFITLDIPDTRRVYIASLPSAIVCCRVH